MPRFAIVENNEIINVIVADAEFIKENKIFGFQCDDIVCTGWEFINGEFVAPEPNYAPVIVEETPTE